MLSMDSYLYPEINNFEGLNCINVSFHCTLLHLIVDDV